MYPNNLDDFFPRTKKVPDSSSNPSAMVAAYSSLLIRLKTIIRTRTPTRLFAVVKDGNKNSKVLGLIKEHIEKSSGHELQQLLDSIYKISTTCYQNINDDRILEHASDVHFLSDLKNLLEALQQNFAPGLVLISTSSMTNFHSMGDIKKTTVKRYIETIKLEYQYAVSKCRWYKTLTEKVPSDKLWYEDVTQDYLNTLSWDKIIKSFYRVETQNLKTTYGRKFEDYLYHKILLDCRGTSIFDYQFNGKVLTEADVDTIKQINTESNTDISRGIERFKQAIKNAFRLELSADIVNFLSKQFHQGGILGFVQTFLDHVNPAVMQQGFIWSASDGKGTLEKISHDKIKIHLTSYLQKRSMRENALPVTPENRDVLCQKVSVEYSLCVENGVIKCDDDLKVWIEKYKPSIPQIMKNQKQWFSAKGKQKEMELKNYLKQFILKTITSTM